VQTTVAAAKLPDVKVTVSGVPAVVAALSAQVKREGPLLGGIALLAVGLCFWLVRGPAVPAAGAAADHTDRDRADAGHLGWLHRPLSIAWSVPVRGARYRLLLPTYFAVRARVRTVLDGGLCDGGQPGTLVLSPLPLVRDLGLTLSIGCCCRRVGHPGRRLVYRGPADSADDSADSADDSAAAGTPGRCGGCRCGRP